MEFQIYPNVHVERTFFLFLPLLSDEIFKSLFPPVDGATAAPQRKSKNYANTLHNGENTKMWVMTRLKLKLLLLFKWHSLFNMFLIFTNWKRPKKQFWFLNWYLEINHVMKWCTDISSTFERPFLLACQALWWVNSITWIIQLKQCGKSEGHIAYSATN